VNRAVKVLLMREPHLQNGTTLMICKAKHQCETPDRTLAGVVPHRRFTFCEPESASSTNQAKTKNDWHKSPVI
jgi:hypothetical protein